jgi:beta-galactosidase
MALVLLVIVAKPGMSQKQARVKQNIDFDWRFNLGDVENGQATEYNDAAWRMLDLPHDFSIEGNYDQKNPGARWNGFLPGGIGWYRKVLEWNNDWNDKLVSIEFDGVYMNSDVWINGHFLGHRPYGYLGIYYNLTPYLTKGKNIIAVRVDNDKVPSARWYTGSGIYRHVWLHVTNKTYVAHWGTYVTTNNVSAKSAGVTASAKIVGEKNTQVSVTSIILNQQNKEVARKTQQVTLGNDTTQVVQNLSMANPSLWSPETPSIYYLKTVVKKGNAVEDSYTTEFGVRKIEFSVKFGFKLNGKILKFKGQCQHQDASCMGIAVPEDVWYSRLKQMKEMGCNAIRTTHNPFPPEFYNMCDTMGLMVLDEVFDGWNHEKVPYDFGIYYNNWWQKEVNDFILRDRNYPCIMMWSMGNEVPNYAKEPLVQKGIYDEMHNLDTTRPCTQAWALDTYIDIAGFNANGEGKGDLERFHKNHPDMAAIGTEIPHTRQTRGVYRTRTSYFPWDKEDPFMGETSAKHKDKLLPLPDLSDSEVFKNFDMKYASGYDNQTRRESVREQWKQTRDNDFFMGEFRWTNFDYLGESWGWPGRTNNYGIIDLAGFPKDDYYLYQSFWTTKPMVHILPHWTWPGMEGITIPVVGYTNCEEAELFLNGKSLGRQKMSKDTLQIVWQVPYKAGKIEAVAYKNGKAVARESYVTAGPAAQIKMSPDKKTIHANRRDVTQITVDILDAKGNFNPTVNDTVYFEISGPYKLLGVENGDIIDLSPNKVKWRKTFMGKASLVLQATQQTGVIKVTAKANGLKQDNITINVIK